MFDFSNPTPCELRLGNCHRSIDEARAIGNLRFTRDPGDRGTLVIRRAPVVAFLLGALLLQERECGAQPTPGVVVDYDAPKECPSAATFRQALARRLPIERTVETGSVARLPAGTLGLLVRVSKAERAYRAELTTVTSEGRSTPRLLSAPVCAELMDAMAFTAALTVDPNATFAESPSALPSSSVSSTTPATSTSPVSPTSSPTSTLRPSTTRSTPSARSDAATEVNADKLPNPEGGTSHHSQWLLSILAGASLTSPLTPGVSPGLLGGLRYADESPGAWSPGITVAAFGSMLITPIRSQEASFAGWGGQVEFCPSTLRMSSLTARPCVGGQLMLLHAEGQGFTRTSDVLVVIPNASIHAEVQHALSARWFFVGLLGTQLLFGRHRFEVGRPGREIASTRLVAPFISLRVGAFLDPAY